MRWGKHNGDMSSDDEFDEWLDCVRVVGNRIYYNGDITRDNILTLNEELDKLSVKLLKLNAEYPDFEPVIKLYITSDGGDLYAGFSAMDMIRNNRVKVITIADGCCASAATFMLLGGHERHAHKHAQSLIHQISSGSFWGKFEELKDEIQTCKKLMKTLKKIYTSNTNIPEDVYNNIMKRDVYLSADKCLEYDIITKLL